MLKTLEENKKIAELLYNSFLTEVNTKIAIGLSKGYPSISITCESSSLQFRLHDDLKKAGYKVKFHTRPQVPCDLVTIIF